jgi:hypothetical protein
MSDQIKQYQQKALDFAADFDKQAIERVPQLQKAQDVGARPIFMAPGLAMIFSAIVLAIFGPLHALNICATLIPVYICLYSLRDGSAAQSYTQWLSYFAFFTTITLFDGVYKTSPFLYFVAKTAVCVYLAGFHGAEFFYQKAVAPAIDGIKNMIGSAPKLSSSASSSVAAPKMDAVPTKSKKAEWAGLDDSKQSESLTIGS